MLCFSGQDLVQKQATLDLMSDKQLLVKETFKGGYSLTNAGFSAMNKVPAEKSVQSSKSIKAD